jgi:tetratricopeptide (TPR) repeat protein
LYRSNKLNADAIDLLEGVVKKGSRSSAVYQLLGAIYQQVELNLLAQERYLTALKLAQTEKNLEAQAIIQSSLGEVAFSLDKLQDALRWYQAAQVGYRGLGDVAKVQELQEKVGDLKGRV